MSNENLSQLKIKGRLDQIREGDLNSLDEIILLREITQNYDLELLNALLNDIEFYKFVEQDYLNSTFTDDDIKERIKEYHKKGLEAPYIKTIILSKERKEKGLDPRVEHSYLDIEALMYPHEFFSINQFKNRVIGKIKELADRKNNSNQDSQPPTDMSTKSISEKIIALFELGLIDILREVSPFNISTNALASALSAVTGEKAETIQSYLNPIISPETRQKNNPLNRPKTVEKVRQKLLSIGYKPRN